MPGLLLYVLHTLSNRLSNTRTDRVTNSVSVGDPHCKTIAYADSETDTHTNRDTHRTANTLSDRNADRVSNRHTVPSRRVYHR